MEAPGKGSLPGMLGIMESELLQILFNGIRRLLVITLVTIIIIIKVLEMKRMMVVWVEILMVT